MSADGQINPGRPESFSRQGRRWFPDSLCSFRLGRSSSFRSKAGNGPFNGLA